MKRNLKKIKMLIAIAADGYFAYCFRFETYS